MTVVIRHFTGRSARILRFRLAAALSLWRIADSCTQQESNNYRISGPENESGTKTNGWRALTVSIKHFGQWCSLGCDFCLILVFGIAMVLWLIYSLSFVSILTTFSSAGYSLADSIDCSNCVCLCLSVNQGIANTRHSTHPTKFLITQIRLLLTAL